MEKEVLFRSNKSRPAIPIISIFLIVLAFIADYFEDQQLFDNFLIYIILGSISLVYLVIMLIHSFSTIIVFKDRILLKNNLGRIIHNYQCADIKSIRINIKHPSTIIFILNSGIIKRHLLSLNIEDIVSLAYLFYIMGIDVDCSGLINDNWKEEAEELYKEGKI